LTRGGNNIVGGAGNNCALRPRKDTRLVITITIIASGVVKGRIVGSVEGQIVGIDEGQIVAGLVPVIIVIDRQPSSQRGTWSSMTNTLVGVVVEGLATMPLGEQSFVIIHP
jgi:hypothetical protein